MIQLVALYFVWSSGMPVIGAAVLTLIILSA